MEYPRLKLVVPVQESTEEELVVRQDKKLLFEDFDGIKVEGEDEDTNAIWRVGKSVFLSTKFDWKVVENDLGYLELVGIYK